MPAILQRARDGHGHFLLLRTEFKIFRFRQNSSRRKNLFDLGNQIGADGLDFSDGNHFNDWLLNSTHNDEVFPGESGILFLPTLPDSTQTMFLCSAGSKSGIN